MVNEIIVPRMLDWMDDDEALSDSAFIQRCLDEIDSRFEHE